MNPERYDHGDKVLTCWKEIAQYLGKGVRTAQRWEYELGLPILRPSGFGGKSPVIAHSQDLDVWLDGTWSMKLQTSSDQPKPPPILNAELLVYVKAQVGISRDLRSRQESLLGELKVAMNGLTENCLRMAATHLEHPVAEPIALP